MRRLAESEARIQVLERRLAVAAPLSSTASAVMPEPVAPKTEDLAAALVAHSGHNSMMSAGPRMELRGFADFSYRASSKKGTTSSFTLGQFDLFMSSKISEHWSVLAESVIQGDKQTNTFGFEVERLLATYRQNEYLNIAFGRYHQKIGYYNTAFHHGTYFQSSVGRPFLFEFEDGGGILPIHNVGVSAYGKLPSGTLGLNWVVEVGNGRASSSPSAEYVQNVFDENNRKSVNVAIFARPEFLEGVEIGGSILKDRLSPTGFSKMGQTVSSAYVAYDRSGVEFLNEAVVVSNNMLDLHRTIHSTGFYSEVSKRFHGVRPFFRYEYLNVNRQDPLFGNIGRRSGPLAGMRFEVGEFAAFKVQYDRTYRTGSGSANGLTGQVSFAF